MNNKELQQCAKQLDLIYKTYWRKWDILDWEFFDYATLLIWDFIAILDERKISRHRYKSWNDWVSELLFFWKNPRKELEHSCNNKEEFLELADFLLKIKDSEKYMWPI